MRALVPRHSLLKVMYPVPDNACLAPGTPLWAVGSSVMLLGERMVTLDYPTLLPPGNEWLALVLRAQAGGGGGEDDGGEDEEEAQLRMAIELSMAEADASVNGSDTTTGGHGRGGRGARGGRGRGGRGRAGAHHCLDMSQAPPLST